MFEKQINSKAKYCPQVQRWIRALNIDNIRVNKEKLNWINSWTPYETLREKNELHQKNKDFTRRKGRKSERDIWRRRYNIGSLRLGRGDV